MKRRRLLQRLFRSMIPAGRSVGFIAVLIGLFLFFANPTTAAAEANGTLLVQSTEQDPAIDSERASAEPKNNSEQEQRIKQRLLTVALVGGVLLLLLAFGYGYLRLELSTRGFYSGRLQIAATIASLSTVTGAYFLWRWLIN